MHLYRIVFSSCVILFCILSPGFSQIGLAQSCDGADGSSPNKGPNKESNGSYCLNNPALPGEISIQATNVDDADDPTNFGVEIDWDDGSAPQVVDYPGDGTVTITYNGNHEYVISSVTHFFEPGKCVYTPSVFLRIAGSTCPSQFGALPDFNRYNTDDQNTGSLVFSETSTGVTEYLVCEGQEVTVTFTDRSTLNCLPPENLIDINDPKRWRRFVYGTTNTITGTVQINGAAQAFPLQGTVEVSGEPLTVSAVPFANNTTASITIPATATVGEVFDVQLDYWNICNAFTDGADPVSTTARIRIVSQPAAPTPIDKKICLDDEIPNFQINIPGTRSSVRWYEDDGGLPGDLIVENNDTELSPDDYQPGTIDNTTAGTYSVWASYVAVANASGVACESELVQITLEIIDSEATVGSDQAFCDVLISSALGGNAVTTPAEGMWSVVSKQNAAGIVTFSDTSDPNATATVTLPGVYVFRWTVTNGTCTSSADIQVDYGITGGAAAEAGDPPASPVCGLTYTLTADEPALGIGTWSSTNAAVVFDEPNNPTSSVTVPSVGDYTFTWSVVSGSCSPPVEDQVTVSFVDPPVVVDLTPTICDEETGTPLAGVVTLTDYSSAAANNLADRTVTWYKDAAPPIGTALTGANLTQTDVTTGAIYVAQVQDDVTGCTNEATVVFTVEELPEVVEGATVFVCEDTQGSDVATGVDLTTENFVNAVLASGVTDVTVTWFPTADDADDGTNEITDPIDITDTETVYARVTKNTEPFCADVAELIINVRTQPIAQTLLGKEAVCLGALELYQVTAVTGATYTWDVPTATGEFVIVGGGDVSDAFVLVSFPNEVDGEITLQVEVNGCTGTESIKDVSVKASPQPFEIVRTDIDASAGLTTDEVCAYEEAVTYGVTPNNYNSSSYSWDIYLASDNSPGGAYVASGQSTGDVRINFQDEDVVIYVTENNESGCAGDPQQIIVSVDPLPIMKSLSTVICSDMPTDAVFEAADDSPVTVDRFDITDVNVSTALTTVVGPQSGVAGQADAIASDRFENIGVLSAEVLYTVIPVAIDGVSGHECEGTSQVVTVSVNPEPQLATDLDTDACSDEAIGLTLRSASGSIPADFFQLTAVNTNGLSLSGGSLPAQNVNLEADVLSSEQWENNTSAAVDVVYTIVPVSSLVGGCMGDPVDVTATIHANPVVDPINPVEACAGIQTNIPLTSSDAGVTFSWSVKEITGSIGGATSGSGTAIQDALVNADVTAGEVVYEVLATSDEESGACVSEPVDAYVTVNPFNATFSVPGETAQCANSEFTFEWTVEDDVTYTWNWADGTAEEVYQPGDLSLGTNTIAHTFTAGSPASSTNYTVQLTIESALCGSKTEPQTITVLPTISLNILPGNTLLCDGETIEFTNNSVGVDHSYWYFRPQGTAQILDERTTTSVIYDFQGEGILPAAENPLIVEVIYQGSNDEGCTADYSAEVSIYQSVEASFDAGTVPNLIAGESTVTFTNTSSILDEDDFDYTWNFGDLLASPTEAAGIGPQSVTYASAGDKKITLVAINTVAQAVGKTCQDTYTATITILVPEVGASFTVTPLASCFPVDLVVENSSPGADAFAWELQGPNGSVVTSNLTEPIFTINKAGTYDLYLTATFTASGQVAYAEQTGIQIFDRPLADFSARATVYVPDTDLLIRNNSYDADAYQWDFGDGGTSTLEEPLYAYAYAGTYEIELVASFNNGEWDVDGDGSPDGSIVCYDTATQEVTALEGGSIRIPNAFTPSLSGPSGGVVSSDDASFNDVFLPVMEGVKEFEMLIYDRWGNLIFESRDQNRGWDGYSESGRLMPTGVYVYKLTLRLSDDQRTTKMGDVTLIR